MTQNQFNQGDHVGGNDECLTPEYIIDAMGGASSFDLDPCAASLPRPWDTAKRMITLPDDGLAMNWFGCVWLNQPYSDAAAWAKKMAVHRNGIMLVFARTETKWFQSYVFDWADAVLFIKGRLQFYNRDGELIRTKKGTVSSAGAPSCLVAYGTNNVERLHMAINKKALSGIVVPIPIIAAPSVRVIRATRPKQSA